MPLSENPTVAVIMGSDSDLPTVRHALDALDHFDVPYEVRVLSAHRSPAETHDYATSARRRGIKVIVCAAGMAAALPGVVAAVTTLPVIGIPVGGGAVQGMDALLSMVQMPPGIPVATVAIGGAGATNAAVLAVQILAQCDAALALKLDEYKTELREKVAAKDAKLQDTLKDSAERAGD